MNTKERIMLYQNLKDLNNAELAKESGISVSTINTLFSNKYDPTLKTLTKICKVLGITLSQFFADDNEPYDLTDWHKEILKLADALPNNKRNVVLLILKEINN